MPRIKSKQIIGERPVRPEHLATKEYVDEILSSSISSVDKRRLAYFHSLSKVMTNANQNIYENKYKGSHNITSNEIWTSDISFARIFQEAYSESLVNDAVKYYNMVTLDPIYGSYGQTYCYIENGEFKDDTYPLIERGKITTGGIFVRPLIGPEDVYDSVTNEISYGYELKLYRGLDATSGIPGTEIGPDEGEWYVNYYTGTIHFSEGFTPTELGWGTIKASFFQYNGNFIGDDYNIILKSAIFENNKIIFNKNTAAEQELDLSTLILTDTIKNVSLNNNKELVLTKGDNSTFKVDLKPIINDVVNNVTYYDNILTFYKNSAAFLEVDINEILLDYGSSFTDADILGDELVFTTVSGTKYSIQISQLQDRSAFNQVEIIDNRLQFRKQDGDIDFVDLSQIISSNSITEVTYINGVLTFYKEGVEYFNVDLESLIETKFESTNPIIDTNLNTLTNKLEFTYYDGTTKIINIESILTGNPLIDVEFNNNILSFRKDSGDIIEIDLSSLVTAGGIEDVQYDSVNKILKFYKDGTLYLNLDLNTIIGETGEPEAFIDANIDFINDQLVFTRANNSKYYIPLSQLQDRTAFNQVEFTNNILKFTKQNGDIDQIDFSGFVDINKITDVTLTDNKISFYKNGEIYLTIDLDLLFNNKFDTVNPVISTYLDTLNNKIISTHYNGETSEINIFDLQDRTAFNQVEFTNSILKFTKQNGDIEQVDFSGFIDSNKITDVVIDGNTLIFYKDNELYKTVDIQQMIDESFNVNNPLKDTFIDDVTNEIVFIHHDNTQIRIPILNLQDTTAINDVKLENNIMVFNQQNGDMLQIDLSPIVIELGIHNVTYNEQTKIISFYKNNEVLLSLDFNSIIPEGGEPLAFVNAEVDVLNDELVFTKANGTKYSIQLSQIQDRSAFNQAQLTNNLLIFTKQDGNIDIVDLNELDLGDLNPNLFLGATFNTTTDILSFDLYGGGQTHVDLSSLKATEGTTSIFNTLNINMTANETTPTSNLACNMPILSSNIVGSNVLVFVNGVQIFLGDDNNCECYFSNDNGVTKKPLTNIEIGDKLYWNYNNSVPYAGYNLSTVDKITFNYLNVK